MGRSLPRFVGLWEAASSNLHVLMKAAAPPQVTPALCVCLQISPPSIKGLLLTFRASMPARTTGAKTVSFSVESANISGIWSSKL